MEKGLLRFKKVKSERNEIVNNVDAVNLYGFIEIKSEHKLGEEINEN